MMVVVVLVEESLVARGARGASHAAQLAVAPRVEAISGPGAPKGPKGPSTAALKALWLLAGLTSAPTLEPPGARGVIRLRPVWPPDRAWRCRDPRYQSTRGPCKPQLLLKPVNKTPDKRSTVVFLPLRSLVYGAVSSQLRYYWIAANTVVGS
jgi:hypothetical protein